MSSKSRNKKKPKNPSDALPLPVEETDAEQHLPTDDLFEVPRGRSKFQFYFLIFLLVFLLIIFIIPGAMMAVLSGGGGGADETVFAYDHPSEGRKEFNSQAFLQEKRLLTSFRGLGQLRVDVTDEDVAQFLMLEAAAVDSGIWISDAELKEQLVQVIESFGGVEAYKSFFTNQFRNDGGIQAFEAILRRDLAVKRYRSLLSTMVALPNPEAIAKSWANEHLEYAFEYGEVAVDDLEDAARAELPEDGELEAWFDDRTEFEKNRLKTPEKRAAQIASFAIGSDAPTALMEAYPEAEDADPSERANQFFSRVRRHRFEKPAEDDGEGEGEDESELPVIPEFFDFADVEEQALAEYAVYFAMDAWRNDLASRAQSGEEIDFAAEAEAVGLTVQDYSEPLTSEEWSELEGVGSQHLGQAVRVPEGTVSYFVAAAGGGYSVAFGGERVEPELPPFAEIRDDVADMWVDNRVADLALERVESAADAMRPVATDDGAEEESAEGESSDETVADGPWEPFEIDETAFAAGVEANGLTFGKRDWLDRRGRPTDDPNADEPANQFLRTYAAAFALEAGQVGQPSLNPAKTHAYVVRSLGSREAPIENMTPQQYSSYANTTSAQTQLGLATRGLSYEELRLKFNAALAVGQAADDEFLEGDDDQPSDDG